MDRYYVPPLVDLRGNHLRKAQQQRRPDGRPEAFDIPGDGPEGAMRAACDPCVATGKTVGYPRGEVFMVGPLDNPLDSGKECYLCREHLAMFLPNVVIVDPLDWSERTLLNTSSRSTAEASAPHFETTGVTLRRTP